MSKRFFIPKIEMENYVGIVVKLHNNTFYKVMISKDVLNEKNPSGQYSAEHDVLVNLIEKACLDSKNCLPLFACGIKLNFN